MVTDSPPQASGTHLPAEEQGGDLADPEPVFSGRPGKSGAPHALWAHPKRQDQPLQEGEGLGPQDQESWSGGTLESGRGGALNRPHPASQIMPDSLEEEAGVSFFGGQEWAPQQTSPAHPGNGTPASLRAEEGEQTSSAWGAGAR